VSDGGTLVDCARGVDATARDVEVDVEVETADTVGGLETEVDHEVDVADAVERSFASLGLRAADTMSPTRPMPTTRLPSTTAGRNHFGRGPRRML
jgi:hypothetical protein